MKKLLALLPLLFLIGCGQPTSAIQGEVLSCATIAVTEKASPKSAIECLDGSVGVDVTAIKGPAIINVWGSWCEPCKEEIPYFAEYNADKSDEVLLLGVDVEEKSPADGRKFVREYGITWPNLYDGDGSTRKYFGMGVPVTWFIGEDGTVVHKKIGVVKSADEIRSLAKKYLGVS